MKRKYLIPHLTIVDLYCQDELTDQEGEVVVGGTLHVSKDTFIDVGGDTDEFDVKQDFTSNCNVWSNEW